MISDLSFTFPPNVRKTFGGRGVNDNIMDMVDINI